MAITTQAGAFSGLIPPTYWTKSSPGTAAQGRPKSYFLATGSPGAGTPTAGLTGASFSTSSSVPGGIIARQDPTSGNAYLARLTAAGAVSQAIYGNGLLLICDRVWDCSPAVAVTTAQTVTTPTLPSRDADGTTAGRGLHAAIEVVAATSATAATISMSYTNSAGTVGQTASFADLPTAAAAQVGDFFRIGLAAGDHGIRSIQSVTFAADWTTGTICLVVYRVLAALEIVAFSQARLDVINGCFPRLYNGTCPFPVFIPGASGQNSFCGEYAEAQG